jgi:fructokinase
MSTGPFEIVGIGEVLWDLLPAGKQLGGAPANFICHAHALGAVARLVSRVGHDDLGREIITRFADRGLPTDTITIDHSAPTGTVSVNVSADGQPHYTIHENVAWDSLEASPEALAAVTRAHAVCFGTLGQRTRAASAGIHLLLAATRPETLRMFDINLRPPFVDSEVITKSLTAANALKLNEQELPVLADMFGLSGPTFHQLATLAVRFSLRLIVLTRGADGSLLLAGGELFEQPGTQIVVRDTVGAGDAFTAASVLGFLRQWPLEKISNHANAVAAFVCSQAGATPPLPEELRQPFIDPAPVQETAHPIS